jgi:AcrR family transcriptional regulator
MPKSDAGRPSRYHHGNLKKTMVQTAIQLIEERGEASFTIRELAKSVGVSHAAAYRHFRSKRELLAQIAEEGWNIETNCCHCSALSVSLSSHA